MILLYECTDCRRTLLCPDATMADARICQLCADLRVIAFDLAFDALEHTAAGYEDQWWLGVYEWAISFDEPSSFY